MRLFKIVICCGTALTIGAGCGGERAANEPPSYQALKQQELASEREEYIRQSQERLSEVERDIQHVQAKLDHEAEFVDQEQLASWKQELFELGQEKSDLQARIDRAQSASPEEWNEMRGTLGTATDSLQAGVQKLRAEVSQALALKSQSSQSAGSPTAATPDSGLCAVEVPGAEAKVAEQGNQVTVTVTTDEDGSVSDLQRRASELAKSTDRYGSTQTAQASQDSPTHQNSPAPSSVQQQKTEAPSQQKPAVKPEATQDQNVDQVEVQVNVQNLKDGVKLTFIPKNGKSEILRARLERDAARLGQGACGTTGVSMNTTPQQ